MWKEVKVLFTVSAQNIRRVLLKGIILNNLIMIVTSLVIG